MNNFRIARLCRDTKKVDIVIPRISSEYNQYVYGWLVRLGKHIAIVRVLPP